MFKLILKETFDKSFSKLDPTTKTQVWKKLQQLKTRAPLGKKLIDYPYWSIHIGSYRVIYLLHHHTKEVEVIDLLKRKYDYRDLKKLT